MKYSEKVKKYLTTALKMILVLGLCFTIMPVVKASTVDTQSGNLGAGSGSSAGSRGTWNYCSAPCYAVHLAADDFDEELSKMSDDSYESINSAIREHFSYKYPSWSDANYVYLVPTFETPGSSGTAHELSAINSAIEISSSYSSLNKKSGCNRIVMINNPSSETVESIVHGGQYGRTELYNYIKSRNGKTQGLQWWYYMDYGTAQKIMQFLVSGGPNDISKRMSAFMYGDNVYSPSLWKSAEDKYYWQLAGYLQLSAAFWEVAGDSREGWEAQITKSLAPSQSTDLKYHSPPVFSVERALGVSNGGAMDSIIDGIDLYQYATGMQPGTYYNLRDGMKSTDSWTSGLARTDFKDLAWHILKWNDEYHNGRAIPMNAGGGNVAGGIGPLYCLLGTRNYSTATDLTMTGKYGLWTQLYREKHYGYNLVFACCLQDKLVSGGRQDIFTDEPKTVTLPRGTTTIPKDIPVHFEANQSIKNPELLKKLKDINQELINKKCTNIKWQLAVGIKRTVDGKDDTDNASIKSKYPTKFNNVPLGSWSDPSIWEKCALKTSDFNILLQILEGKVNLEFEDKTTGDPINNRHKLYQYHSYAYLRVLYNDPKDPSHLAKYDLGESPSYDEDAKIQSKNLGWMQLVRDDGEDYKEFKVDDNLYHYDSEPVSLSELKQNEPMKEEWEAMSGTVTTRPLYFASGGSEFAVTIDCTPMNGELNRNYSVEFPGWKDEHYGTTGPCKNCGAHPGYYDSDDHWHPPVYCSCSLGSKTESWTQKIKYSYMRINTVKIWRVKTSAVTGMKELTPMSVNSNGDLAAQLNKGDEAGKEIYATIFTDTTTANGGSKGTGSLKGGRFRLTEQPETENNVKYKVANNAGSGSWGEGPGACSEKKAIPPRRDTDVNTIKSRSNDIYVQSDYVVLHTKEGDMVLNYSETTAHSDNLTDTIDATKTPDELWWNNQLCPSKWKGDEINQFWYNGDFANPQTCFTKKVSNYTFKSNMLSPMKITYREEEHDYPKSKASLLGGTPKHDIPKPNTGDLFTGKSTDDVAYPMNMRWERGYESMPSNVEHHKVESETCNPYDCRGDMEMWRQFNPLLTFPNKQFNPGNSSMLYERILSYYNQETGEVSSPLEMNTEGNISYVDEYKSGAELKTEAKYQYEDGKHYLVSHSAYSKKHKNCNSIIIHNPVSAEYSYVLSLPKDRDQRTDRSKTLSAGSISAMTDAQSEDMKITNENYHNNLVFNGFVKDEKKENDTLGWKTGIGTALGWETLEEPDNKDTPMTVTFGCDVNKGITIESEGHGKAYYYQDIPATAGNNYILSYESKALEGSKKATVELKYLDSAGNYVSNDKAVKLRVLITQPVAGKSLINEIVVKNMSKGGFIPVNTTFYDIKYATVENRTDSSHLNIDSYYHYWYRDNDNGDLVDCLTKPSEKDVKGSQLVAVDSSRLHRDHTYTFSAYSFSYASGKSDSLEDGLDMLRASLSGEEIKGEGVYQNTVVGKTFLKDEGPQMFMAPEEGYYLLDAFGANGGDNTGNKTTGGKGAHTSGIVHLNKGEMLKIEVGNKGYDGKEKIELDSCYTRDMFTHRKRPREIPLYSTPTGIEAMSINGHEYFINDIVKPDFVTNGGAGTVASGTGGGATTISTSTGKVLVVAGGGGGAGYRNGENAIDTTRTETTTEDMDRGKSALEGTITEKGNETEFHYDLNENFMPSLIFGGGGGGYHGGNAGTEDSGAQGGDSYVDEELTKYTTNDVPFSYKDTKGNGRVQITYMKYYEMKENHQNDPSRITVKSIASHQYNNNAPADAYVTKVRDAKDASPITKDDDKGKSQVDTFINLDYGFSVYFPNEGDFEGDSSLHGISDLSNIEGKGYRNKMDTTEWTYAKYVQFPVAVVFEGKRYQIDEKIYLDVNKEYFDFYCVLGNHEQAAAKAKFVAIGVNNPSVQLKGDSNLPNLYKDGKVYNKGTSDVKARNHPEGEVYKTPMDGATVKDYILDGQCTQGHTGHYQKPHTGKCQYDADINYPKQKDTDCYSYKQYEQGAGNCDNTKPSNVTRTEFTAKHSGKEVDIIDVVGRIGNYIIDDVGDPYYASFFKKPDGTGNYLVPGVVPTVDQSKQNYIVGDTIDIRKIDMNKFGSSKPNLHRGDSKNVLSQDLRGAPYNSFWCNLQGEPKRPGDGYGDKGNDPLGQTTYDQNKVFATTVNQQNAFLNTYARTASPTSPLLGVHDNEFGQMPFKTNDEKAASLPLTSVMNNIPSLKFNNLRLGYPVYQDIQTIGDYFAGTVQVSPTYYALDLDSDPNNPTIIPVDVYMSINGSYYPINLFGASQVETSKTTTQKGSPIEGPVVSTVTNDKALVGKTVVDGQGNPLKDTYGNELKYRYIFDNKQFIDWDSENIRRNASIGKAQIKSMENYPDYGGLNQKFDGLTLFDEKTNTWDSDGTPTASQEWRNSKEVQATNSYDLPFGLYYATGNNQVLNLTGRCRTYIGESDTYGQTVNRIWKGSRDVRETVTSDYYPTEFMQEGQRWHFTNNLPSSAVVIKAGSKCNSLNIKELRKDNYVILTALDIKSLGAVWTLQYAEGGENTTVDLMTPSGTPKTFNISSIHKGKVVVINSATKSATNSYKSVGTH